MKVLLPPDPLARALDAADRALAIDLNNPTAYFSKTLILMSLMRFEAAHETLRRFVFLAPNDTAMLGGAAIYLGHLGEWDEALSLADRVEELNPLNNGWSLYARTNIYFQQGRYEEALREARTLRNADATKDHVHVAASLAMPGRVAEA